jgi:hypothetical protein
VRHITQISEFTPLSKSPACSQLWRDHFLRRPVFIVVPILAFRISEQEQEN